MSFNAKPFLKWAGGKGQLLPELEKRLPADIRNKKVINRYIEPFVGGGALFFFLKSEYDLKESFLFDVNRELMMAYQVIKKDYKELIEKLKEIEAHHLQKSETDREKNYYNVRGAYNRQMHTFDYAEYNPEWIRRVGYLIFLNKTCFNGLFRQNSKGEFNVPFGRYKNPKICDAGNLREVHQSLENTYLFCGNFSDSGDYIKKKTFVYMDPPYRPLNRTSHFTDYYKGGFNDEDQIKLADFFKEMHHKGACLMLSNSDPKNQDVHDDFFDSLYKDFVLERVPAKRNINRDASKRGEINELIIRNYLDALPGP